MDERDLDIQKLRKSVADAKQLHNELREKVSELNELLIIAEALKSKAESNARNTR
jgi:hypothetical protein